MRDEPGWFQYVPHWLTDADTRVLLFVNRDLYHPWLAWAVSWLADDVFLTALIMAGLAWVWRLPQPQRKEAQKTVLAALVALAGLNLLCNLALKPLFLRPRPWNSVPELKLMVQSRATSSSFPSNHTAMAFGAAWVLAKGIPRSRWIVWTVAAAVAFFCVYSGGHYPLDVLAGMALGLTGGYLVRRLTREIF
jgi:undecaprenyl-diphosphatase